MSISLNYTSFTSSSMAAKITNAMQHVMTTGDCVRILNRNKLPFLLVTLVKDSLGYTFRFLDTEGRDVGHMILKASCKGWADEQAVFFWQLNSAAYDLTEHPMISVAREEARQAAEELNRAILKDHGVTHVAHSWGGSKLHVAYQRNWLGKRVMYVLQSGTGNWLKVTKEALACIRHVEAF